MRLAGRDIVCLSARDWDHPSPTPTHAVMARLAMRNRVLFVEAPVNPVEAAMHAANARARGRLARYLGAAPRTRRVSLNLWVHTPPPFGPRRRDLRLAAARLGFDEPILWLACGADRAEEAIGTVCEALVVVHCCRDLAASASEGAERRILSGAHLVFCSTPMQAARSGGIYIPSGDDYELSHLSDPAAWDFQVLEMEGYILDRLARNLIEARLKLSSPES